MKLEIGNFVVKDVAFGAKTGFANGIFTVNKEEALAEVMKDEHITEAELHIVKPGDEVRLVPVKDALEIRCRVSGAPGNHPGVTSDLRSAATGRVHSLTGASLLVVGKHWGSFQDGLIDMGGPFQRGSLFGFLKNIVLVADTDEEFERHEQQKKNHALRWAGMRLAEFLGKTLADLTPDSIDVYELDAVNRRDAAVSLRPQAVSIPVS